MPVTGISKTVTVPGTPERFVGTSTPASGFIVQAKIGNTGYVGIGGYNAHATNGPAIRLVAGQTWNVPPLPMNGYQLYEWFVDVEVANEGIDIVYQEF